MFLCTHLICVSMATVSILHLHTWTGRALVVRGVRVYRYPRQPIYSQFLLKVHFMLRTGTYNVSLLSFCDYGFKWWYIMLNNKHLLQHTLLLKLTNGPHLYSMSKDEAAPWLKNYHSKCRTERRLGWMTIAVSTGRSGALDEGLSQ